MNHHLSELFQEQEYFILDNFLPSLVSEQLLHFAATQYQRGLFRAAKIVKNHNQPDLNWRRDEIYWLDLSMLEPSIQIFLQQMHSLQEWFNEHFFLGLQHFEAHFAIYNPGSFYKRHVDQFKNNNDRLVSLVYYLNPQWTMHDGGHLNLYNTEEQILAQILPQANRLVCFRSHLPHEVMTTNKSRFSIACWFKCRKLTGG